MPRGFDLRVLEPGDDQVLLDLMDDAVAWLNSRGITKQWGSEPFSADPRRRAMVQGWLAVGHAVLASESGQPAGALVLGDAPDYVPPPSEDEVYVNLLVSAHRPGSRGVGRWLLDHAAAVTRERGVSLLRVDCFAGEGSRLPAFYESCGFTRTSSFTVGDTWEGVVLERRLT
jgi:ribosomal protein S18 acetylase RimI-like enzyme